MNTIPIPVIERLSTLYTILKRLDSKGIVSISSKRLGSIMGVSPFTIRKDVAYLEQTGSESGYDIAKLKDSLFYLLNLSRKRNACVVGMGRLGNAIVNFSLFSDENIHITAGFDSNINVIETLDSKIPLFPAFNIPEKVKEMDIEIGVIAVPPEYAQITAERLIRGGVRGIMNFAPVVIQTKDAEVVVKNFHIMEEFRILSILMDIKEKERKNGQDI